MRLSDLKDILYDPVDFVVFGDYNRPREIQIYGKKGMQKRVMVGSLDKLSPKDIEFSKKNIGTVGFALIMAQQMGYLLSDYDKILPTSNRYDFIPGKLFLSEEFDFAPIGTESAYPEIHAKFEQLHILRTGGEGFMIPSSVGLTHLGFNKARDIGKFKESVHDICEKTGAGQIKMSGKPTTPNFDKMNPLYIKLGDMDFVYVPTGVVHASKISTGRGAKGKNSKVVLNALDGLKISEDTARDMIWRFLNTRVKV